MAGRPKGALGKKTRDLLALCAKERVIPFQGLLKLCKHPDDNIRLQALKEACKYLYPTLKAIEVSQDPEQFDEQSSYVDEAIAEFKNLVKLTYGNKK